MIKLDRAFVTGVDVRAEARGMAAAILQLSAVIGAGIVAEGVETEAQLQFLRAAGCGQVQGYLIARPLPAAEVRLLLADRGEWVSHPAVGSNPETPRHSAA